MNEDPLDAAVGIVRGVVFAILAWLIVCGFVAGVYWILELAR